jgi:hypothetical protein
MRTVALFGDVAKWIDGGAANDARIARHVLTLLRRARACVRVLNWRHQTTNSLLTLSSLLLLLLLLLFILAY